MAVDDARGRDPGNPRFEPLPRRPGQELEAETEDPVRADTPKLAKLTRPRLFDAIRRERLFRQIDEGARSRRVTWIESPPGAGKTTLAASYLDARDLHGIWFQVDAGDNDLATFFYYLGLAERALPGRRRHQRPLPLFTPEYLADVAGFARRFFRTLFERIGTPGVLVFDNFQEADHTPLHEAVVAGMDEVPEGLHLIIVSRAGTPPHYARLAANRALTVLDWEALKFTHDETATMLAAARLPLPSAAIDALHDQADGWAVGLVLLAEHLRRGGRLGDSADSESLQQVFAYFAGQMFDRATPADRHALLQLSFAPSVTESLADRLTGSEHAARLLEQLYRRHLFTDRRRGDTVSYQFHALFRAFLQNQARQDLEPGEYRATARRCGELLDADGQSEAAFPLYGIAGEVEAAAALVLRVAPSLIGQGRWRVVVDWIEALPAGRVQQDPWLLHWLGTARIGIDPPAARGVLSEAHRVARECGDGRCRVQIAAGMVEALFLEYGDFVPIDPWIPELSAIQSDDFEFRTLDEELRAQSALLVAATYRQPDHPGIDRCASRVSELLRVGLDANLRVSAAAQLAVYGSFTGHLPVARNAVSILVPLLDDPAVSIFRRAFAWSAAAWYAANATDLDLGHRCILEVEQIARVDGLHVAKRFACIIGYFFDMDRRDYASGARRIDTLEQVMDRGHPYDVASIVNMKAYAGLFLDDAERAAQFATEAASLYESTGSIPHILVGLSALVWCHVERGDEAAAASARARHRAWSDRRNMEWAQWVLDAGDAVTALRRGDESAVREALAKVFALDRDRFDQYGHMLSWAREWAVRLAAAALVRRLQCAHVARYVESFALPPPAFPPSAWPFPVRIRVLGGRRIEVGGEPIVFQGKVPRRPLALLHRLVTADASGVRDTALMDALWPDEDGDAARDAFRVALHRLRRLLGDPESVQLQDGVVRLSATHCWVDTHRLRALLHAPASALPARDLAEALLDAYGGPLDAAVGADADPTQGARLAASFARRIAELLSDPALTADGDTLALAHRAFAVAADQSTLAEWLMRAHLAANDPAAVLRVDETFAQAQAANPPSAPPAAIGRLRAEALARLDKASVRDR